MRLGRGAVRAHSIERLTKSVGLSCCDEAGEEAGNAAEGKADGEPAPSTALSRSAHVSLPVYWMTRTRCASAQRSSRR